MSEGDGKERVKLELWRTSVHSSPAAATIRIARRIPTISHMFPNCGGPLASCFRLFFLGRFLLFLIRSSTWSLSPCYKPVCTCMCHLIRPASPTSPHAPKESHCDQYFHLTRWNHRVLERDFCQIFRAMVFNAPPMLKLRARSTTGAKTCNRQFLRTQCLEGHGAWTSRAMEQKDMCSTSNWVNSFHLRKTKSQSVADFENSGFSSFHVVNDE